MPTLFMETTQVKDTKTVAEIQHLLALRGASSVMVEYDKGNVESVSFKLKVHDIDVPFRLPCRWKSVEILLKKSGRRVGRQDSYEAWARRVGWRQVKRWVEAQLALIETGMAKAEEVFLPYAIVQSNGKDVTMFEVIEQKNFLALPAPEPE